MLTVLVVYDLNKNLHDSDFLVWCLMLILEVCILFVNCEDKLLSVYEPELSFVDLQALVKVELDHRLVDQRLVRLVDLKGQPEYAALTHLEIYIGSDVLLIVS